MWWLLLVLSAPPRTAAVQLLRDWALPTVVQKGDKVGPDPDLSTVSTVCCRWTCGATSSWRRGSACTVSSGDAAPVWSTEH